MTSNNSHKSLYAMTVSMLFALGLGHLQYLYERSATSKLLLSTVDSK